MLTHLCVTTGLTRSLALDPTTTFFWVVDSAMHQNLQLCEQLKQKKLQVLLFQVAGTQDARQNSSMAARGSHS